jgi:hypothetical protein
MAIVAAEGGALGALMLRAVNAIADAIKPEFPDVAVDGFAFIKPLGHACALYIYYSNSIIYMIVLASSHTAELLLSKVYYI